MTDASADNTQEAPPEANDPHLSSGAKDAFFADPPPAPQPVTDAVATEVPEEHPHHGYDVKFREATIEDADFDAEETNPKEVSE